MSEPGATEWWEVLKIHEWASSVAAQLDGLPLEEQIIATDCVAEFFEFMLCMIYTPHAASTQYGEIVAGLDILKEFLASKHGVILVVWNSIAFKASRDEFGCVMITSLTLRTRLN
jgi:hypothetical protein